MTTINRGFTYCNTGLMSVFSVGGNSVCRRHSWILRTQHSALHLIGAQWMETAISADQKSTPEYLGQFRMSQYNFWLDRWKCQKDDGDCFRKKDQVIQIHITFLSMELLSHYPYIKLGGVKLNFQIVTCHTLDYF